MDGQLVDGHHVFTDTKVVAAPSHQPQIGQSLIGKMKTKQIPMDARFVNNNSERVKVTRRPKAVFENDSARMRNNFMNITQ